jgi:3-deoxy-D-manno-octulosonate 8-phosphate phosphatase (KDO 8-P phosphatase)
MLPPFSAVRHFVFDIDGVLTDGQLLISETGLPLRTMNIRDGYALQRAVKQGYKVSILSGATGDGLKVRLNRLGIEHIALGIQDKLTCYLEWLANDLVNPTETLYMGDDMPDVPVLSEVLLPCAPFDACADVLAVAQYVSPKAGGKGCVRDVIEKVMRLHGTWG